MKNAILLFVALNLCSCAIPQYGSFVDSSDKIDTTVIATDSVDQLARIFPPAKTRIAFAQPTNDQFGKTLVEQLRQRGYAIREFIKRSPFRSNSADSEEYMPNETGLRFNYVIDRFKESDTYRISITVDDVTITRAYIGVTHSEGFGRKVNGAKIPRAAGDWAISGA